jgi:hypothetical protein
MGSYVARPDTSQSTIVTPRPRWTIQSLQCRLADTTTASRIFRTLRSRLCRFPSPEAVLFLVKPNASSQSRHHRRSTNTVERTARRTFHEQLTGSSPNAPYTPGLRRPWPGRRRGQCLSTQRSGNRPRLRTKSRDRSWTTGGGSAGAVMAARLCEKVDRKQRIRAGCERLDKGRRPAIARCRRNRSRDNMDQRLGGNLRRVRGRRLQAVGTRTLKRPWRD